MLGKGILEAESGQELWEDIGFTIKTTFYDFLQPAENLS